MNTREMAQAALRNIEEQQKTLGDVVNALGKIQMNQNNFNRRLARYQDLVDSLLERMDIVTGQVEELENLNDHEQVGVVVLPEGEVPVYAAADVDEGRKP